MILKILLKDDSAQEHFLLSNKWKDLMKFTMNDLRKQKKKNDKTDRDNLKYKKKLKTDFSAFSDLIVFLIE